VYVLVTSPCASACSGIPTSAAFRSRDSNRVNVSASRTPTKEDAGLAEGDNYSGHIAREGWAKCPAFPIADAPTICFPDRGSGLEGTSARRSSAVSATSTNGPVLDVGRYGCNIGTPGLLR